MNSKQFISQKLNRKTKRMQKNPTEKTCKKNEKHTSHQKNRQKKMKKKDNFTNFSTYYAEKTKNITLKKNKKTPFFSNPSQKKNQKPLFSSI